jgi:hypothetical protein
MIQERVLSPRHSVATENWLGPGVVTLMLRRAAQGEFEDRRHIAEHRRDAHCEGLARTSAENQTAVKPEGDRNMSAPTERADPDLQLRPRGFSENWRVTNEGAEAPSAASASCLAPRPVAVTPRAGT